MGVSGSGKTTLGKALSRKLAWDYFDADDFHSVENISKMAAGLPLTDTDRAPWLAMLHRQLVSCMQADRHPVMACSALKEKYRQQLLEGIHDMAVLYLQGDYESIRSRLLAREGHYMKENMLQSQFATLEQPGDALVLDAKLPVENLLAIIFDSYPGLRGN